MVYPHVARGADQMITSAINSFQLVIDGETAATVPRTTSHQIGRFKAYATQPRRR